MLQGCTAHYLCASTYQVKAETLPHTCSCRRGRPSLDSDGENSGGCVIGTVSTESKAELARNAGADEVILYNERFPLRSDANNRRRGCQCRL